MSGRPITTRGICRASCAKLGWKADVLNWDPNDASQIYYHGEDFRLDYDAPLPALRHLGAYLRWIGQYDIFHFSNAHGIRFGDAAARRWSPSTCAPATRSACSSGWASESSIRNNGCLDGVSQTSFASWGTRRRV